ncbi:TIGR00255 family protein [Aedoeadaptatus nemausensis]|uniref:TIGR00255 family protein n=1 Tax=Aedoeadaptatus nemausensis TaxID=2582829 RepID=A0A6V6XZP6_9FIRM|nr:YicC/YloC family endoribonuclease [Peptoniphilus nemausensis]CAC9924933.1 TIGR00255 family protein [Peptoniphilus nemausensis]
MHSMTGFGSVEQMTENTTLSVVIKSVNHKNRDIRIKGLGDFQAVENNIKKAIERDVFRGRIEVSFSIKKSGEKKLSYSEETAEFYISLYEEMAGEEPSVQWLLSRPGVVEVLDLDEDISSDFIQKAFEEAFDEFLAMRKREGSYLSECLKEKIKYIESELDIIKASTEEDKKTQQKFFRNRVEEFMEEYAMDPSRFATELALLYEKISIEEEIDRLYSHIEQFNVIIERKGSVGRSLDFLLQEMFREANTMANKSRTIDVLHRLVDVKTAIDDLREQVANVE